MEPSVELIGYTTPVNLEEPLDIIEYAGRWDYGPKSISKMGDREIIGRWIKSGEESMLEMVDVVFLVTCSRVVSHELVRHRVASYQQESQRYVKYDDEEPEELFYIPPEIIAAGEDVVTTYRGALILAQQAYKLLKKNGVKSQIARYVLPNATRTRIVVKMNLRELRHVLRLRMHKSAQPEMQIIATKIYDIVNGLFPEVFADIDGSERAIR